MGASEFYVYVVALMCGVSMMMPINAVFSAPSYITTYYLYATHNPNHVPMQANFWSNVMTYYNLLSMVTSLIMEPLTLLKSFRRIPMLVRLLGGLIILIVEIILLIAVPARGTSENGAVATVCCAGFIGGFGKSIFESTVYGMFGAFPPSFTSTMMGGVGVSGVITSLIQIIVKAALPNTYEGVKKQSYIYYSLDVGIQGTTFFALIMLRFNSFAREHFGDLGGVKSKVDAGSLVVETYRDENVMGPIGEAAPGQKNGSDMPVGSSLCTKVDPLKDRPIHGLDVMEGSPLVATAPVTATVVGEAGLSSNEILRATAVFTVFRDVKWMFVSCGFTFLITLFLFPSIATGMFPRSKWFATVTCWAASRPR